MKIFFFLISFYFLCMKMKLLPHKYFCVDMFIHLNPRNIKTFPDMNVYLDFFAGRGGGANLFSGSFNITPKHS